MKKWRNLRKILRIWKNIQTLYKVHRNSIETLYKIYTKFIQTWYKQTLDYVCMIFKFNLKEDCIYFVCNLSYVWLLYMAWYLYGPCMKFVWGLYAICMKYELCMSFEFFDGSNILYYHRDDSAHVTGALFLSQITLRASKDGKCHPGIPRKNNISSSLPMIIHDVSCL